MRQDMGGLTPLSNNVLQGTMFLCGLSEMHGMHGSMGKVKDLSC